MKILRLFIILVCIGASPSFATESCKNDYIKVTPSTRKESALYLLKVPEGFDFGSINIKATYDSLSARQRPTHNCIFTTPLHSYKTRVGYPNYYKQGSCINNKTGRSTSIYGSGYKIARDGNTTTVKCYSHSECAILESSSGNRIAMYTDISSGLHKVGYLIRDCSTGSVEGVSVRGAIPGYIIMEHSVEKGYSNTYKASPSITF